MWRTNPENIQQSVCLKVWAVRRDRVRERYSLSCSRFVCARDGQREERERVLSVAWAAADSASEFDIPRRACNDTAHYNA